MTTTKTVTVAGGGLRVDRVGAAGSSLASLAAVPTRYALEAAYPNPFNPTTEIRFALPEAGPVSLVVYDVTGREVARPVDGWRAAGVHRVRFEAGRLPSGLYLYRLTAGTFSGTRRMVLLK